MRKKKKKTSTIIAMRTNEVKQKNQSANSGMEITLFDLQMDDF